MGDDVGSDELSLLCYKYGSDKCPQIKHYYTPFYYKLLKDKCQTIKKVLELGVGYYEPMKHVENYRRGASLYMWRDFFPNAQIYGADWEPKAMFKEGRIETFLCDERKKEDLVGLIEKTGPDIDLFVDDGSHLKEHQAFTCQTVLPLIKRGVIYIIEDVGFPDWLRRKLSDYDCRIPRIRRKWRKSRLMIVRRKND